MDIYIEYVIIDNMVINSLLLWAAGTTSKSKITWWKVLFSAAVGTAFSCIMPLVQLPAAATFAVKFIVAPILVLLAFFPISVKKLLWSTLIFVAYTFALGGTIIALLYGGMGATLEQAAVYYSSDIPIGAFIGGVFACVFIVARVVKYINYQKKIGARLKNVVLIINQREIMLKGFFDTGNNLIIEGIPVCFAVSKKLKELLKEEMAIHILSGKSLIRESYMTVSGSATLTGINAELMIEGIKKGIILAPSHINTEGYDLILNNAMEEIDNEAA